MTSYVSIDERPGVWTVGARRRVPVRAVHGERLAIGATAVAIALLPLGVPSGPANAAPIDVFVAAAVVAAALWAGASGLRCQFPYALPAGVMLAGGALGAIAGRWPVPGALALVQDVVLVLWCWTVANVASTVGRLGLLLRTWAYVSIVWVLLMIVGVMTHTTVLSGQTERQGHRAQLTLADPSYAANYFFISIMVIWATGRPRRRSVRIVAYALLLIGIALTGSNSGVLSVVTGTVVATSIGTYRRFGWVAAVGALGAMVVAAALVSSTVSLASIQDRASASRYGFIRDGIGRGTSVEQRGTLLRESLRLYRDGSLLGEGPVSTKPRLRAEMAPFEKEAHDDYLAALIERGVVGFAGILALVAALLSRMAVLARARTGIVLAVARPNALVGAAAGTLVAGTVYELLHVRHVWALFALLAAASLRRDGSR